MDFTNERYVRIYTRKTVPYVLYPWQTRAIRDLIFKELDRAGVLELGEYPAPEAVSAMIQIPLEVVEVGLPPLLKDGTLVATEGFLVSPNFIDAQEAAQSDKARQKASREKRRDLARLQTVTDRDDSERRRSNLSQDGQDGHARSQSVTPSLTVPNRAVPGLADPPSPECDAPGFDIGHLAEIYDEEHRSAGHGPYKPKRSEYNAREDAHADILGLAEQLEMDPAKVARLSICNYFKCADDGLKAKGYPFWGWSKAASHFYNAKPKGPLPPTPPGNYDVENDDSELLDRLAKEQAEKKAARKARRNG